MGGLDGKIFGSRTWRTWAISESQVFSYPAGPNLVNKYFNHMTNLGANLHEVLTREALRFCSRANAYGSHTGLLSMVLQRKNCYFL